MRRAQIPGFSAATLLCAILIAPSSWAEDESTKAAAEQSPPTVCGEWKLNLDFAKIDQQWDALLAIASDQKKFAYQIDEVSAWSVGQQVGHLGIVMNSLAVNIEILIKEPEKDAGLAPNQIVYGVLKSGLIPRGVGKAPEEFKPSDDITAEEVKASLIEAQKRWDAFAKQQDAIAGIKGTFPHFAFGPLMPSEWVRLAAVHNAHHLKIVDDIVAAAEKSQ